MTKSGKKKNEGEGKEEEEGEERQKEEKTGRGRRENAADGIWPGSLSATFCSFSTNSKEMEGTGTQLRVDIINIHHVGGQIRRKKGAAVLRSI